MTSFLLVTVSVCPLIDYFKISINFRLISINFFETKMNILGNKFNIIKYFNKVLLALRISNWCKDIQTFKETILIM